MAGQHELLLPLRHCGLAYQLQGMPRKSAKRGERGAFDAALPVVLQRSLIPPIDASYSAAR
jgi:hypothetical protein